MFIYHVSKFYINNLVNKKRPGGRFLFVAFVLLSDYLKETLAEVMATFPK